MDSTFNEDIAPAVDRTAAGIDALKSRNLMTLLREPFTGKWLISPGTTPKNQTLAKVDENRKFDVEPRSENERVAPKEDEPSSQQVSQSS